MSGVQDDAISFVYDSLLAIAAEMASQALHSLGGPQIALFGRMVAGLLIPRRKRQHRPPRIFPSFAGALDSDQLARREASFGPGQVTGQAPELRLVSDYERVPFRHAERGEGIENL